MVSATERAVVGRPLGGAVVRRARALLLRSEALRGYLLLSPTLLVIVGMMIAPMVALVALSFWTQVYFDLDTSFTLQNYWTIVRPSATAAYFLGIPFYLETPIYALLLVKSILMSLASTVAVVLLAYPMAYFLAFRVTRHKLVWLILITVPFWTSYLLRVFAWKVILGFNGVINSGLIALGLIDAPLEFLLYNPTAVVITLAHAWAAPSGAGWCAAPVPYCCAPKRCAAISCSRRRCWSWSA